MDVKTKVKKNQPKNEKGNGNYKHPNTRNLQVLFEVS